MGTNRLMAFGDRNNALFVRAPLKGITANHRGTVGSRPLLNGQLSLVRSKFARKQYALVFKGNDVELQSIRDFTDGRYGQGPWLFNHPRSLNGNVLPRSWSAPGLIVGAGRGNLAMDLFSNQVPFGAPLSATLNNPNLQPLTITGLAGAPLTGACIWSPNNTAPVLPVTYLTRPFLQTLIPPGFSARFTVWGAQNTGTTDPGVYYSLSAIPAATVAAGTKVNPVLAGAGFTVASSGVWRVLDIWIGSGTATASTNYTTFGAMDLRLSQSGIPAQPTVFDFGRGQFPSAFTDDNIAHTQTQVGNNDDTRTFIEIDMGIEEVAQPW